MKLNKKWNPKKDKKGKYIVPVETNDDIILKHH
jgi:hypothetical protein